MKRERKIARDERVMRPRPLPQAAKGWAVLCQGTGRVRCTLALCFVLISKGHYYCGFYVGMTLND